MSSRRRTANISYTASETNDQRTTHRMQAKTHKANLAPLSSDDSHRLAALLERLEAAASSAEVLACMNSDLQAIYPHSAVLCATGLLDADRLKSASILPCRFMQRHLAHLLLDGGDVPVPAAALRIRPGAAPCMVDLRDARATASDITWHALAQLGLRAATAQAIAEPGGLRVSYFCLGHDAPDPPSAARHEMLSLLTPDLHRALHRTMPNPAAPAAANLDSLAIHLSYSQTQILHWLHLGKTNGEIAQILRMSEANVKYHLRKIFSALKVSNRVYAVTKALSLGLIDP